MKYVWILIFFCVLPKAKGQDYTQTVRGWVKDRESQQPLEGVKVAIYGNHAFTFTDSSGSYRLEKVPIGRITLSFSLAGYKSQILPDVLINSAREAVFSLEMDMDVNELNTTKIKGRKGKMATNNELVMVSGRSFTIDQTNRFAGSLGDPSRMASNFAGVSGGGNDQRNDIVIRGNSGLGLLWRLEGVDIPNPNHFSSQGANGGPVSMLNNNILSNSDFLTGAFPAEYGNATAGVFDLKMRNGNSQKREYQGQVSFAGVEMLAEGPLYKKNSSYLISYRYSTLDFFNTLGITFGNSGVPKYQDLSWKFHMPFGKNQHINFFGVWGKSGTLLLDSKLQDDEYKKLSYPVDISFSSRMGVAGLSHSISLGKNSYIKTTVALTMEGNDVEQDTLNTAKEGTLNYQSHSKFSRATGHSYYNHRLTSRHSLRIGVLYTIHQPNMDEQIWIGAYQRWNTEIKVDTFTQQQQGYINWQWKPHSKWILNTGLAFLRMGLNGSSSIDPRFGMRFLINQRSSLSAGLGIHSQTQPLLIYFQNTPLQWPPDGRSWYSNADLGLQRNAHAVLGYDLYINEHTRIKTEGYFQHAWGLAVNNYNSGFSLANLGADFGFPNEDSLKNEGKLQNKGIEVTLERFFHHGFYYLLTGSLYRSRYTGSDGIWRNTVNDGKFVINVLGGKEWKKKNQIFSVSGKVTWAGGKRFTPLLELESKNAGRPIYDLNQINAQHLPHYFRFDIRIGYKRNSKKITQEWAIDIQNVLNTQNVMGQYFDRLEGKTKYSYQLGIFPVPLYRIQF